MRELLNEVTNEKIVKHLTGTKLRSANSQFLQIRFSRWHHTKFKKYTKSLCEDKDYLHAGPARIDTSSYDNLERISLEIS